MTLSVISVIYAIGERDRKGPVRFVFIILILPLWAWANPLEIAQMRCETVYSDDIKIGQDSFRVAAIVGGKPEITLVLKSASGKTIPSRYTYLSSRISVPGRRTQNDSPIFTRGTLRAQRDGRAEIEMNSLQLININASGADVVAEGDLFFNLNGRDYYARYFCNHLIVDPIHK